MRLTREMASWKRKSLLIFSLLLLFQLGACKQTVTEDDDTTNTFVRIVSVTSAPGGDDGEEGTDLFSDVCFANEDVPPCSVFNDNAIVIFSAFPKDQSNFSSTINDVVFERYRVTYTRSDGLNVPGVDVPYPFDGVSSFMVPADGSEVERAFIVVRHQAKQETPLRELTFGGGGILSVLAQIDFYGRDGAGRQMMATAFLNITFADFGNE